MKRALFVIALVAVVAAYMFGQRPERARAVAAEAEVARLTAALASAEDEVRFGRVLGDSLRLSEAIAAQNFGEAAGLSSVFFDHVREEAARTSRADLRDVLTRILRTRDEVTGAVARADAGVLKLSREHGAAMRKALGYPVQ